MQLLKIGGEFDGGVVISISKHGVMTRRNNEMQAYSQRDVEEKMRALYPAPQRSKVTGRVRRHSSRKVSA